MSAERLGPDDTWPTHQKPFWRSVLAEARAAGWTLHYVGAAHNFGSVFCPSQDDDVDSFFVDMTATGGETKAREAVKKIRQCRHSGHPGGSRVRERQEECARMMVTCETLLDSATAGLHQAEAYQAAEEELEQISLQLQTAAANAERVRLEHEADEALAEAIAAEGAPAPDEVSHVIGEAEDAAGRVTTVARQLRPARPVDARSFLRRVDLANTRIADLRNRLRALQERIAADDR